MPDMPTGIAPPTHDEVMAALATVIDPELGADIVSLGMVPSVDITPDGVVTVGVKLTIRGCPLRAEIKREVEGKVSVHPGVADVKISWGEMNADERSEVMTKARWNARQNAPDTEIPLSCKVLAIASGKGGVGKSSVTVNLAAALADAGYTVGVLDADIWGFSVPRLLGISDRMEARKVEGSDKPKIVPNERSRRFRRAQGGVDGLPGRGGHGADVARAHADQGGRAVPARRPVGPSRLPVDRHATRHGRRADGSGEDAAEHVARGGHHACPRCAEGGPTRRPTWRGAASSR